MKKIAHKNRNLSKGFSTIELIITLFVASAFLFSGYQLYTMIIKDGGETRAQARASNAAYGYLQDYKANDTYMQSACAEPAAGLLPDDKDISTEVSKLANPKLTVKITCPYETTAPTVTKIEVTIKYGNNKSVTQATYVNAT